MVFGTLAEWVSAGATIFLFIAASIAACLEYRNLKAYRRQLDIYREEVNLNMFQALLREISDEQVSLDRGLLTEYIT